jgi:hypothetical protein
MIRKTNHNARYRSNFKGSLSTYLRTILMCYFCRRPALWTGLTTWSKNMHALRTAILWSFTKSKKSGTLSKAFRKNTKKSWISTTILHVHSLTRDTCWFRVIWNRAAKTASRQKRCSKHCKGYWQIIRCWNWSSGLMQTILSRVRTYHKFWS